MSLLGRSEMPNRKPLRALAVVSAALALFLFWQVALSANSIGPPTEFWFTLDYETAGRPTLEGVQIIGCATADCAEPTLLAQHGACHGPECVAGVPTLTGWADTFECAENLCRLASRTYEGGYLRLVAQFSDRTRVSGVVGPLPWEYGMEKAWRVRAGDSSLGLEEDADFSAPGTNYGLFLAALTLTLAVELLVAAAFAYLAHRNGSRIRNVLTVVFLINLITVPVVWYTFPSWGRFQTGMARSMGWVVLALFVVYALLLAGLFLSEGKRRRVMLILTILSLPVSFVVLIAALFITSYGNYDFAMQGLSPVQVVILSEVFAVVAEAVLIGIMARKWLRGWQAVLLSLLANAASFSAGLWIMGSR